ncbi:hypothetical protein D9M72_415950 [compost metagenome]
MDLAGVLLLRGRVADDGAQRHDRGLGGLRLRGDQGGVQFLHVFLVFAGLGPVHTLDVPAVGLVALEDVLGESDVGVVLNGDVVLVVHNDEVAEFLVAGQRGSLGGHAFLEVAVGGNDPDGVVERRRAGGSIGVEQAALAALGVSETDRGRQALAQRAGGDFHTGGVLVLRVSRSQRTPGPQRLQVLQFQAVAGEEQLDVQRQGRVAGGEDEPVAADPVRVIRVVAHQLLEEKVRGRGEAHRGARVAVAYLFDRVRGQNADRVNGSLVQTGP